jgi:hypothetical protein
VVSACVSLVTNEVQPHLMFPGRVAIFSCVISVQVTFLFLFTLAFSCEFFVLCISSPLCSICMCVYIYIHIYYLSYIFIVSSVFSFYVIVVLTHLCFCCISNLYIRFL